MRRQERDLTQLLVRDSRPNEEENDESANRSSNMNLEQDNMTQNADEVDYSTISYNELCDRYRINGLCFRVHRARLLMVAACLSGRSNMKFIQEYTPLSQRSSQRLGKRAQALKYETAGERSVARDFKRRFFVEDAVGVYNKLPTKLRDRAASKEGFKEALTVFLNSITDVSENKYLKRNSLFLKIRENKITVEPIHYLGLR